MMKRTARAGRWLLKTSWLALCWTVNAAWRTLCWTVRTSWRLLKAFNRAFWRWVEEGAARNHARKTQEAAGRDYVRRMQEASGVQVKEYKSVKAYQKDVQQMAQSGWVEDSIVSQDNRAGVVRVATLGIGALVLKPRSSLIVTYKRKQAA